MTQKNQRITIRVSDEFARRIETRLEYGDSRSEWLREAARRKLAADDNDSEPQEGAA